MNRTLWVVQTVVALAFLVAGLMMMLQPIERLKQGMNWVAHSPRNVVRLVGIMAILGSLGLVFPGLTHILPWLTPVAAALLGLMMIGAILVHLRLKEYTALVPPSALFVLLMFVVYGRSLLVSFS